MTARRDRIVFAGMLLLAFFGAGRTSGQQGSEEEILAEMIRGAARETSSKLSGRQLALRVSPADAHPMLRQIFSEEAGAAGAVVTSETAGAAVELAVDVRGIRASTVSLGNSSYLRTLSASFGVYAGDRRGGSVLWTKEYRLTRTDTLRGVSPTSEREFRDDRTPGWIESLLTPLLVTAVAAVIIVLLFTVRGS